MEITMATIRKCGERYQVQIRKTGQPLLPKSFKRKSDAQTWAKTIESEVERGTSKLATPSSALS
jgi:hypothetical protein